MRLPGESPKHDLNCSRAGCDQAASWSLAWRNPKIHLPERKKYWLACTEHLQYLTDFLNARSFPLEVTAIKQNEAEQR